MVCMVWLVQEIDHGRCGRPREDSGRCGRCSSTDVGREGGLSPSICKTQRMPIYHSALPYTLVCSTMFAINAGVKNSWNRPRTEMDGFRDGIGPTSSLKAATFNSGSTSKQSAH